MKKLIVLLSLVAMVIVMPTSVHAATWSEEKVISSNSLYGVLSAKEKAWEGSNPTELEIYITKSSGYIYMSFVINNLKNVEFSPAANIEVVSKTLEDDTLTVLLKTKDGKAITSKTEIGSAYGYPIDTEKGCNLNPSPLSINCLKLNDLYFDKDGKAVTEEAYTAACSNVTTDPGDDVQTGSVVPYVAIAGGLIAIAGVYLYSRRTNKMYKL